MKQGHDVDCENSFLKPWYTELLKFIKDPTDGHVRGAFKIIKENWQNYLSWELCEVGN